MFKRIKKFFSKEKSEEATKMWEKLSDGYTGDPEFHPNLNIDAKYALSLNDKERNAYLTDLMHRRNEAHEKYITQRIRDLDK